MKDLIKKEILSWMNEGLPSGKTIPIFEDILDKFEALVIEEVMKEIEDILEKDKCEDSGIRLDDRIDDLINKLKNSK